METSVQVPAIWLAVNADEPPDAVGDVGVDEESEQATVKVLARRRAMARRTG
jgi:hypothetical protein